MIQKDTLLLMCAARDALRDVDRADVTVRRAARDAGMSPHQFIRLFKAVFGQTPWQCRLLARLDRARLLLATGDAPVTDICMDIGFSSLGSFSALFSRRVGVSPSAFRRRFRPMARAAGAMPAVLIPGCLALMCACPTPGGAISEKRAAPAP